MISRRMSLTVAARGRVDKGCYTRPLELAEIFEL